MVTLARLVSRLTFRLHTPIAMLPLSTGPPALVPKRTQVHRFDGSRSAASARRPRVTGLRGHARQSSDETLVADARRGGVQPGAETRQTPFPQPARKGFSRRSKLPLLFARELRPRPYFGPSPECLPRRQLLLALRSQ